MCPSLGELVPGTDHEIFHRPRYNDLSRFREIGNSRADMDGYSAKGIAVDAAFAGMYPRANFEAEWLETVGNLEGTGNGSGRRIESRDKPVSSRIDFAPAISGELGSYDLVMRVQRSLPGFITQRYSHLGGTDDVGNENRGQEPIRHRLSSCSRQKRLDRVEYCLLALGPVKMILPRKRDQFRPRYAIGKKHRVVELYVVVVATMENESWYRDRGQDIAHIDF